MSVEVIFISSAAVLAILTLGLILILSFNKPLVGWGGSVTAIGVGCTAALGLMLHWYLAAAIAIAAIGLSVAFYFFLNTGGLS